MEHAMFETLEVGKRIKNRDFDEQALPLRQKLLETQFELDKHDYSVIIVVAGLDGSGKGSLVHRLNEWMDPRGIETNTYWEHSDEEESRPFFWRSLPSRWRLGGTARRFTGMRLPLLRTTILRASIWGRCCCGPVPRAVMRRNSNYPRLLGLHLITAVHS